MIEWTRPTGTTITTNDDKRNIEVANKLGWKRVKLDKKERKEHKKEAQHSLIGS
jgi:hypothetical protein